MPAATATPSFPTRAIEQALLLAGIDTDNITVIYYGGKVAQLHTDTPAQAAAVTAVLRTIPWLTEVAHVAGSIFTSAIWA